MPKIEKRASTRRRTSPKPALTVERGDKLARDIGRRIVEAREGLGFSQQAMHTRSKLADPGGQGISRSVLSLYETGINKPGARELMILCETLHVTPNWLLYGSDSPARTLQASLEYLRGSELDVAARLAFAILALDPEERDSFASLVLASVHKKLGDVQLSSLMWMASMMRDDLKAEVIKVAGDSAKDLPISELIPIFVKELGDSAYTNWGTLRPSIPEDQIESFDPSTPPSPRKLKKRQ